MSFIINVFVNSEGMKKLHILLCLLLWSMPNIAHAQFNSFGIEPTTTWEREAKMQRKRIPESFQHPKAYRSEFKNRFTTIYYRHAAESVTDETTGMTTIKWEDGAKYYGQTYFGEIRGIGTIIYPDGSRYCGEWKKDQPNGNGSFISPEGIAFTGKFKNGVPYGKCIMQDLDGRLYSARWVRGKLKEKSIKPYKEE
ncbi:MAG: hypothetical protein IKB68_07995 [Rikenellaceae bacterium]|nr:hypothetical protein [Rikenellaceae bacterium]